MCKTHPLPPLFEGKRGGGDEGDWLFEDLVIKVVLGLIVKFGLRVPHSLREERGPRGEFLHKKSFLLFISIIHNSKNMIILWS